LLAESVRSAAFETSASRRSPRAFALAKALQQPEDMLLRLLTTGLCAAAVILLATFQPVRLEVVRPQVVLPVPRDNPAPPLSVVDALERVGAAQLADLVHLKPHERVSAVNDRLLDDDLPIREAIAALPLRAGGYIDLTVSGATGERRVLVLLH
jgi:hypothetical protein